MIVRPPTGATADHSARRDAITKGTRPERRSEPGGPDNELACFINRLLDSAPPLTSEQRDKLALLLHKRPVRATTRSAGPRSA
jgi:hypothetical protein